MVDGPYHMVFLLYSFWMVYYRAYYTGYVDASGETVDRLQEGVTLRRLRYGIGLPFLIGSLLYLLNPEWMSWSQLSDLPDWLRVIGMVCLLGSVMLYRWTHVNLDKNFTDTVYIREKAFLVTAGPYQWIRHPMYVSACLGVLGIGLGLANWFLGLLGAILMFVIMYLRTPIEEAKLLKKHGELYEEYRERTGKFFPKL